MSEENVDALRRANVEIARRLYANPRDFAQAADLFAPDAAIDFSAVYPDMGVVHGFDEVRRFRETGPWGEMSLKPERFFDVDDERVLVFVRVEASGRGSSVPVVQRTAHVLTVRGGLISSLKIYLDRDEALQSVGLGE